MGLSLLPSFLGLIKGSRWRKASKCKSLIKKLKCRLLITKNRRKAITRQLHADIAQLLQHGYHQAALERVEQLYKDQLILSAYDQVDKFCDCVRVNLGELRSNSKLSDDVCEAVASLIFAASRCGELPELHSIRILFSRLLGQNFERANVEQLPGNRVNSQIKHNLSKKSVAEDVKIQLLNEMATEDKHHVEPQIKVPAQTLSKEFLEATGKYECRNLASYDRNGINAQPQASNFEEMLQRVGPKFCLTDCRNMVTYWSNNPNSTDKIAGSFTSAKANATAIHKRHRDEDIMDRVASTVSANKGEGAIPCLDNKERQSSRREDFRTGQDLNASETCMSFKRSNRLKVTDGNCNGMIKQALKDANVYSCQNAGHTRARIYYHEDKEKKINSSLTHVHPKLPDYDDLVAKFTDLKEDKMRRSSSNQALRNWFLR